MKGHSFAPSILSKEVPMILKFIFPSSDFKQSIRVKYENKICNVPEISNLSFSIENKSFCINNLLFLFIHHKFKTIIKQLGNIDNFLVWNEDILLLKYPIVSSQTRIVCAGRKIKLYNEIIIENNKQLEIIKNIFNDLYRLCLIEEV